MADVANTKTAAAAQSPMPPPSATPGTSGKKRKRSAASLARDKLVSSKKYQTYELYEALQSSGIINDPSELGKLQEHLTKMVRQEAERREEFEKELRDELWKKRGRRGSSAQGGSRSAQKVLRGGHRAGKRAEK